MHAAITIGSRPDSIVLCAAAGIWRGWAPSAASAMAAICAGVVPQQPPTMLTSPASSHSRTCAAVSSAASS